MSLIDLDATELVARMERKETTAEEAMTACLDQIDAGPQVQMVCVSQQDVGPDGVNVGGIKGFDRTLGRHGHEGRRGHVAVGGVECSDASAAVVGFKGERFMMVDNRPDLQKAGLASWPL